MHTKGKIRSPWVIKRISSRTMSDGRQMIGERLKFEADVLRKLNHPNIVGFRGTKVMANEQVALAMENCDTSLGQVLEQRLEEELGPLNAKSIIKVRNFFCY